MPRKKTTNLYFHQGVEDAIHQFNKCDDERERNRLFRIIYPALAKLAEVWRNKIKPTYIELPPEELEMDCITFLLEKIHMVKEGKGKAFSYLTVTARNYYIMNNDIAYRKRLKGYSLDAMHENFDVEEVVSDRVEQMEHNAELFTLFVEYMEENFDNMFPATKQKVFAKPFIDKIKTYGIDVEFNRRDMLNELAEETGIQRGLVTKHVNRIASFYSSFRDYYEKYGAKPQFKEKMYVSATDEQYIKKNYEHYSKHNGLNGISRQLGINYDVLRKWVKESI